MPPFPPMFMVTAGFAARTGDPATGGELIGATDAERERTGTERKPDEAPFFDETLRASERRLGDKELARARERGKALDLEGAAAIAVGVTEREQGSR